MRADSAHAAGSGGARRKTHVPREAVTARRKAGEESNAAAHHARRKRSGGVTARCCLALLVLYGGGEREAQARRTETRARLGADAVPLPVRQARCFGA